MANTVNDVMNVIASPDYGIKNIAGTNQEILAILSGTHNSQNNIHTIVDDVRNLLQTLVETSSQQKPVEVGGNSSKINHKHIQSILDETKEIRKAIIDLSKALSKQGGQNVAVAKLSDKASEKVAEAMAKNIEKQNKGAGLSSIVDAFNKLRDISLKDILIGQQKIKELMTIFKNAKEDLNIDDKELNSIIKLINTSPELVNILVKIGRKVNKINKNDTIAKLKDILVGESSILTISTALQENKNTFEEANKTASSLKDLITSLNKAMRKLLFASLWAKLAYNGIKSIESVLDKTLPIAKKLTKNKKDIDQGAKSAKDITVLVGNLLITSIFLTIAVVFALPAMLGALALKVIVNILIPVAKKLGKNNKQIGKAVISAIGLAAFTGIMTITSLLLTGIAKTGLAAILGSILVLGIVTINIITFKMLGKAQKNILKGAISMLVLSLSLIVYGIALGKITKATKDVSLKQIIMIALLTGILVGCVIPLGIPQVFALVMLGSIAMLVVGLALISFGTALSIISKAAKNLKMKSILLVAGSMMTLGLGIASMAALLIPVLLGSVTVGAMSLALLPFVGALKIISDMKTIPTKQLNQVLSALKTVGNFFKKNSVSLKAVWNAAKYMLIMPPFTGAVACLSILKKVGAVPMKLVYQALNGIKAIGDFFKNNPIPKKAIKESAKYMLILVPFGISIRYLNRLKKMGTLPMKLVYQALNAIQTIANYYEKNPISKSAIKASKRYSDILRPFGNAIKQLTKLKEMGTLPMKLVYQTLSAISAIADFYQNRKLGFFEGIEARISASMITGIIKSFAKAVDVIKKLSELRRVPTDAIDSILYSISGIVWYYRNVKFGKNIKLKSLLTEYVVNQFTTMAMNIQDTLANIKPVDDKAIKSIVLACIYITNYYRFTKFLVSKGKINRMNNTVRSFVDNTQYLKDIDFNLKKYISVVIAVKSMKRILRFLKRGSLNPLQRLHAKKNLSLLNAVSTVMTNLSNINTSSMSSIGDALSDALSGVNTVDMGQVIAVTNMFNAFNKISKSENIINKFTESVKEFTETCKELMDAMGNNTDAINNIDMSGNRKSGSFFDNVKERVSDFFGGESNDNSVSVQSNGMRITNVDEVAKAIAEKINGALSVDVADTQIQLLINGTGGNEWTITKY